MIPAGRDIHHQKSNFQITAWSITGQFNNTGVHSTYETGRVSTLGAASASLSEANVQ